LERRGRFLKLCAHETSAMFAIEVPCVASFVH
jgi:hypothetical protein